MDTLNQLPTPNQRFKNFPILVIEDDPDQWLLIQNALKVSFVDIKVVWASTSSQALAYLNDGLAIGLRLPFMIFLDLYLPDRQNGWQLLEQIRSLLTPVCSVPIVMLSSSDQGEDIHQSYERGVTSYLIKPATYQEWVSTFNALKEYWWEVASLPGQHNRS